MRILLIVALLSGCVTVGTSPGSVTAIAGMPGPEDLTWDAERDRMLVSSSDRREETAPGQIYAVKDGQVAALKRSGEPDGFDFNPHGISLVGDTLYVISHSEAGEHSVLVYGVGEGLTLKAHLRDPLLTSPNDLVALPDGTLYVSNDKSEGGGLAEIIWRQKKASVVLYRDGAWSVAADELAMPNGLAVDETSLYVAITREDGVFAWDRAADGALSNRRLLASVKSPDNLTWHNGDLVVACHLSDWAFLQHARRGAPAPTYVARIGLDGAVSTVFEDPGARISGASTAVSVGASWWFGQVFEPFVLVLER
jgi:hypothetical protein